MDTRLAGERQWAADIQVGSFSSPCSCYPGAAIAHSTATKPASKLTNAPRNWLVNDWKFVKVSFVFNVEGNSCLLSGNPPCCCPCQWPVGVVSLIIFSSYK